MSFSYIQTARKILCIGRNYAAHIAELNNLPPSQPFFFLKPSSSILLPGQGPVLVPRGVVVHHEIELAVILNKDLKDLSDDFTEQDAINAVEGYALAIDMTARNVQDEAKKKGLPWTIGKGFDTFLPLSSFIPKSAIKDPYNVKLFLNINGETKQSDSTSLMIFKLADIFKTMSRIMTLQKGDLILTGTPKGVGAINPGDKIEVGLISESGENLAPMEFDVAQKPGPYVFKET